MSKGQYLERCEVCDGLLRLEPQKGLLECAQCGLLYDPLLAMFNGRQQVETQASSAHPSKLLILRNPDEIELLAEESEKLHFRIRVKSTMRMLALSLCLTANVFVILWLSMLRTEFDVLLLLLGSGPALISLFLCYFTYQLFVRRPELVIDRHFLIGPALIRQHGEVIDREQIQQFSSMAESQSPRRRRRYCLVVKLIDGSEHYLLDSLTEEMAHYLEQRLEQFLHILDQPISSGESVQSEHQQTVPADAPQASP